MDIAAQHDPGSWNKMQHLCHYIFLQRSWYVKQCYYVVSLNPMQVVVCDSARYFVLLCPTIMLINHNLDQTAAIIAVNILLQTAIPSHLLLLVFEL
jgi:hypothetical protein